MKNMRLFFILFLTFLTIMTGCSDKSESAREEPTPKVEIKI
jgi:hypothetical protein